MRLNNDIALKPLPGNIKNNLTPKSEIILPSGATGKYVKGTILEAAVDWQDKTLLFLTDDTPFHEMLRILLLDSEYNIIDTALIGGSYRTGAFSELKLQKPNTLFFKFIGDHPWEIKLLSKPKALKPFVAEPRGVSRPVGFLHHFLIQTNTLSQTDEKEEIS